MGTKPSVIHAIPCKSAEVPDETEVFRNPSNKSGEFQTIIAPNIETLQDLFINTSKKFAHRSFLGSRSSDGFYTFRTYEECFDVVNCLGDAIMKLNLSTKTIDEFHDLELDVIGIFAKNREEWVFTDLACMINGITTIPFFETVTAQMFVHILKQTNLTTIFCSNKSLEFILEQPDLKNLETIVCFDILEKTMQGKIKERGLDYCNFNDLLQYSGSSLFKLPKLKPHNVYTISYTSGTGFDPKGVIITHRNIISALVNGLLSPLNITYDDVYLSYLPLAHIFERYMINLMMCHGSQVGFYNGEMLKLKIDISDLKPTIFASVPKMYNKLFNCVNEKVSQLTGMKKFLYNQGISAKIESFNSGGGETSYLWDKLVFNSIRKEIGSKFKWMLCAAAPIHPSILLHLRLFCSCPIYEAYGLTESSGGTFLTYNTSTKPGAFGTAYNVEFKIRSVGNMDYSVDYKDSKGVNKPRGELLIRGPGISPGYFKQNAEAHEGYEANGWLKTGDIVELDRENGSVFLIDRKKDIFKLAFGEYIAPAKIEKIYLDCQCVKEIIVHGEPVEEYLVAIVVVNLEWLKKNYEEGNIGELLESKEVKEKVLTEMNFVAKEANLFGFETVRKVHLIEKNFESLGLLTHTFKVKRFEVKKHFEEVLRQLYKK